MTVRWHHGVSRDMLRTTFRDWFGIGDAQADILVTLYDRGGKSLTSRELAVAVNSHRPLSTGALHERISVLRQAMESEAVDFDECRGYCLTDTGLTECTHALRQMAIALMDGFELRVPPAEDEPAPETRARMRA